MLKQMNFSLNTGSVYSLENEVNYLSEKLPSEVRGLFKKCCDLIRVKEAEKTIVNIQQTNKEINTDSFSHKLLENGTYMGMKTFRTTKNEALKIMEAKSAGKCSFHNNVVHFSDIGLSLCFDKWDILKEITIEISNKSETSKGLKIGDHIEKALSLYGQPTVRSLISAIWPNLAVTIEDDFITSIRVQ